PPEPSATPAPPPLPIVPKETRAPCALRVNLPVDLSVTAGGAAAWIISQALQPELAPSACRWCDRNLNGLDAGVKAGLRWNDTKTADTISNVTGFVLTPLGMLGLQAAIDLSNRSRAADWGNDALILSEALVVAMDVNQTVKFIAGRQRPFVHDPGPSD